MIFPHHPPVSNDVTKNGKEKIIKMKNPEELLVESRVYRCCREEMYERERLSYPRVDEGPQTLL